MITVTDAHTVRVIARHPVPRDEAGALRAELLCAYRAVQHLIELHLEYVRLVALAGGPALHSSLVESARAVAAEAARREATLRPLVERAS